LVWLGNKGQVKSSTHQS